MHVGSCRVWATPGPVTLCSPNPHTNTSLACYLLCQTSPKSQSRFLSQRTTVRQKNTPCLHRKALSASPLRTSRLFTSNPTHTTPRLWLMRSPILVPLPKTSLPLPVAQVQVLLLLLNLMDNVIPLRSDSGMRSRISSLPLGELSVT